MKTGLFGIEHSNRNVDDHWGKNCFNSSFPTSLACYMMEKKIPAIYVHLEPTRNLKNPVKISCGSISMSDVFNCGDCKSSDLEFDFETAFHYYQQYAYDSLDNIDLVVCKDGKQIRPIEIKLTAFPDNTTASKPKEEWGSEIVVRSATMMYCALGIFDSVSKAEGANKIRDCFEIACSSISDWKNDYEVTHKLPMLLQKLNGFEALYYQYQKPVLMQVLWKTKGKTPFLEDDAFQVVIWSDFAFEKLVAVRCDDKADKMSRPMTATARLINCLWELSKSGKINLASVYRELAYTNQNDKEFSVPGMSWRRFLKDADFSKFPVSKNALDELIDPAYIDKLSPERRLDQTIFFTYKKK
jgi:hypothetical protein